MKQPRPKTHPAGHADEPTGQIEPTTQRSVQSVEVGGRLLLALSQADGPLPLKQLATMAGLTPSRAHPHLVSFMRLAFVEQHGDGRYALGPAAFQMGLTCMRQADPLRAAWPVSEALVAQTGQSVAVVVWANHGPTVVRLIEGPAPLHVNMRAGTVLALLGTASGRAFAAVMPRDQIAAVLAMTPSDPARSTWSTPGAASNPDRASPRRIGRLLNPIIDEFRAHGIARTIGAPIPGIHAISGVARNHEGRPALVITALGHEDSFDADWDGAVADAVRDAVRQVSLQLGHAGHVDGDSTQAGRMNADRVA